MAGLSNEEMRERLRVAFESGKMSETQYLRNLEKFPVQEPEPEEIMPEEDKLVACPDCDFEIVEGSTCPFCEAKKEDEIVPAPAQKPEIVSAPRPAPVQVAAPLEVPESIEKPKPQPKPDAVPAPIPDESEDLIHEIEENLSDIDYGGSEKSVKVTQYVDKLISLGVKSAKQRENLIIHYMGFDESHMQKEIEFNDVHTDLMEYFVEAEDIIEDYPESNEKYIEAYYDIPESVAEATMVAQCDSCGHDSKGKKICPRCGADQVHRVTERQLIAVAMVLLLIGVGYIGIAGAYADTPIVMIGDLKETDNYRLIRVNGTVVDLVDFWPEKYSETGTIRMLLNDGTGDIWVKVAPFVTEQMIERGIIPGFGDRVDCEGSLFVGDDNYMQIKVRDISLIRILPRNYQQITLDDLVPPEREAFDVGTHIEITGQIQGNYYIEGFARILDLANDDGKSVSIFIPDTVGMLTVELDMDDIYLSTVTVKGALEWYDSDQSWEIIPASNSDFEVISHYEGDSYTTLTVDQVLQNAEAYEGGYVEIHNATVTWAYGDGDWLFSISDATTGDDFSVIIDSGANTSAPFHVGDVVYLRGLVIPYQDSWELKIRSSSSDFALIDSDYGGA